MSIYRKVIETDAVFRDDAWFPDIDNSQPGISWVLLDFDESRLKMVIELWTTDSLAVKPSERKNGLDLDKFIAGQGIKAEKLAGHVKSPAVLARITDNKTKAVLEEG